MTRSSEKQERILAFINQYIEENGFPPAVREIGAAVGLKSTATVSYHLGELKRQGRIQADAGMDIGGTLIGMHLRPVAVPVRLSLDHIGSAILLCARTRPKYIGGGRAVYAEL